MPRIKAPAPPRYHVTRRNWIFPFGKAKGYRFDEVFPKYKEYVDALIDRGFISVNESLYERLYDEYYCQDVDLNWWDFC